MALVGVELVMADALTTRPPTNILSSAYSATVATVWT